jgi:hypothetical protein
MIHSMTDWSQEEPRVLLFWGKIESLADGRAADAGREGLSYDLRLLSTRGGDQPVAKYWVQSTWRKSHPLA